MSYNNPQREREKYECDLQTAVLLYKTGYEEYRDMAIDLLVPHFPEWDGIPNGVTTIFSGQCRRSVAEDFIRSEIEFRKNPHFKEFDKYQLRANV